MCIWRKQKQSETLFVVVVVFSHCVYVCQFVCLCVCAFLLLSSMDALVAFVALIPPHCVRCISFAGWTTKCTRVRCTAMIKRRAKDDNSRGKKRKPTVSPLKPLNDNNNNTENNDEVARQNLELVFAFGRWKRTSVCLFYELGARQCPFSSTSNLLVVLIASTTTTTATLVTNEKLATSN